jgi:HK97 family phage portal protein
VDAKGEKKEVPQHDLLKLLQKPNEFMSQQELFESLVAFLLISGNAYLDMSAPYANRPPMELWPLRSDRLQVVPDAVDFIKGYNYKIGETSTFLDKNRVSHLKFFNPLDDFYGLSPIEVAARGIDNDNAANAWNNSLLTNGARPTGALSTEETLTEVQYDRLDEQMSKNVGKNNAGKTLILEGGLKWQDMSLSPRDMDFINSKKMSILEICAAFQVPPEVVGYGENKTYANYEEARKALYEDAILPILDKLRDKLNSTLVIKYGDNLYLDYDKDSIEALKENSDIKAARIREDYKNGVITLNEARAARGYEELPGGDTHLIPGSVWVVDENNNLILGPKQGEQNPKDDPGSNDPKEGEGKKGRFFTVM